MSAPDQPAERPTLSGDLYVYGDEDLSRICGELYAQVRELEGVDDTEAEAVGNMVYDLLTGDWD